MNGPDPGPSRKPQSGRSVFRAGVVCAVPECVVLANVTVSHNVVEGASHLTRNQRNPLAGMGHRQTLPSKTCNNQ